MLEGKYGSELVQKEHLQKITESFSYTGNVSLHEIITLAEENSAVFYSRFEEYFPDFSKNLLRINPNLRISELTLCAYIYLNFSTKEIATFTFRSVRTIQTRKSHLRKKLHISSSQDMYAWMKLL